MLLHRALSPSRTIRILVTFCCVVAGLIATWRGWESRDTIMQQILHSFDTGLSTPTPNAAFRDAPKALWTALTGFQSRMNAPILSIQLGTTGVDTIMSDRNRALREGVMSHSSPTKARIFFEGKAYNADLRLKGDLLDHWELPYRMSLRLSLKNGYVLGYSEFSLHKPQCRQHPFDQAFQELMRSVGNLAASHQFVRVIFNGSNWGWMDMEEHMSTAMLEKQNRKESLIVRFGNELIWKYRVNAKNPISGYRLSDDRLFVNLYDEKKHLRDPISRMWLTYICESREQGVGVKLYEELSYGMCLSATTIWGNAHTLAEENLRHYFNPFTLRLEPITTDQGMPLLWNSSGGLAKFSPIRDSYTFGLLWDSPSFREKAMIAMESLIPIFSNAQNSVDHYWSAFPLDERPLIEPTLSENIQHFRKHGFDQHATTSEKPIVIPSDYISPEALAELIDIAQVRHYDDGSLRIHNLLPIPITLTAILVDGQRTDFDPIIIPSSATHTTEPYRVETSLIGIQDSHIAVDTELQGKKFTSQVGPTLYSKCLPNPLDSDAEKVSEPFSRAGPSQWNVPTGEWSVLQTVCIPGDLNIEPGAKLKFAKDACLIIQGTLRAVGTAEARIELGPEMETWRGLFVLNASATSTMSYVDILKTSALESGMLRLTGGVNFYKSDLHMSDCRLLGTRAEDGMNLVQSKITLERTTFQDTNSDALDLDFCLANITSCNFKQIGGDAMDFSGCQVRVSNSTVNGARDKGISVGEASRADLFSCCLIDVGVGVACKDGSNVIASYCTVTDSKIAAMMTYVKKLMFSPPSMRITALNTNAQNPLLRQRRSLMELDGNPVQEIDLDVSSLYQGPMRK